MKTKIHRYNILFIDAQILLTIVTVILFVVYFFNNKIIGLLQLFLGLTLFSLSFNNYKIYNKKNMTFIYLGVGLIVFILGILHLVGVI